MKIKRIVILTAIFMIILIGLLFFITNKSSDMNRGFYLDGSKVQVDDYVLFENNDYYINYEIFNDLEIIDSFNDKDSNYIQLFYEKNLYEINYNLKSNTYIEKNGEIFINLNYLKTKTDYMIDVYGEGEYLFVDSTYNLGRTINKSKIRNSNYITSDIIQYMEENQIVKIYDLY